MQSRRDQPLNLLKFACLLSFLFLFIVGLLNYTGFCVGDLSYISDKKKIQLAVNEINKQQIFVGSTEKDLSLIKSIDKYKPYKSTKDFLEKNPGCCVVTTKPYKDLMPPVPFWDRMLGLYSANIKLSYDAEYEKSNGLTVKKHVLDALKINNCGQIFR